jgi:hypothetical protein
MLVPVPGWFDTTEANGFPASSSIRVRHAIARTNTTTTAPARFFQRARPWRVDDRSHTEKSCQENPRPSPLTASAPLPSR